MQIAFTPHKNAAHRLACLSLYRALLRQCTKFPFRATSSSSDASKKPTTPSSTLQSLIRYRYRQDRKIKNWQHIRNALQFGRGALQLLETAAGGSPAALAKMSLILQTSSEVATKNMAALKQIQAERDHHRLPKKHIERKTREILLADKSRYNRHPHTVPVLERPVPYEQALKKKDGRRRVPNYFVAQGTPFLRYTHRQPLSLSRYMQWQIKKREKLWDRGERGQEMMQMAGLEDEWDSRLWQDHRLLRQADSAGIGSASWADTYRGAVKENQSKIVKLDSQRIRYGEKLFEVFLKEEALAKIENAQRKETNRKIWLEQKADEERDDKKETEKVAALFNDSGLELRNK